jgi:hypothetical protein
MLFPTEDATMNAQDIAIYFDTITDHTATTCSAWASNSNAGRSGKATGVQPGDVSICYTQHDPRDGDEPTPWMVSIPVKVNPRRKSSGWMQVRGTGSTPEEAADAAITSFQSHHQYNG